MIQKKIKKLLMAMTPAKLKAHRFSKPLAAAEELPPPSDRYLEMETAKAFHYPGWSAWLAESEDIRAELIAHEMLKCRRRHYYDDLLNRAKQRYWNHTGKSLAESVKMRKRRRVRSVRIVANKGYKITTTWKPTARSAGS